MNAEMIYQTTKEAMDAYVAMNSEAAIEPEKIAFFEKYGLHIPLTALYKLNAAAREEMYKKGTKGAGKPSLAAVKRFLRGVPGYNKAISKAWWADGRWWLCDGIRAVGLKEAVDTIPTYDPEKDNWKPVNISQIMKPILSGSACHGVPLPEKAEIKQAILDWKANKNGKRGPMIKVGTRLLNAQFLLDMVEILPNAEMFMEDDNALHPVFFQDEAGNVGVLLPVRP